MSTYYYIRTIEDAIWVLLKLTRPSPNIPRNRRRTVRVFREQRRRPIEARRLVQRFRSRLCAAHAKCERRCGRLPDHNVPGRRLAHRPDCLVPK